ncbi:hypothetical protein [Frankia sp. Cr2]|uniref:hypothetical protein n=1 Tax=Frankia sp. Cr2 TaxID=3073932 RepID=UPI002AD481FE|nr:hypothetical protein [Frankia sp. Cr2]
MSGDGQPSAHRRYALALLAADEAYDRNPQGEPVLFVSDFRRGLLAVLALTPEALLRAGDGVTEGEALAFLAGQRAALDAAHTALAAQWQPDMLRRRVPRTSVADTVEPGRLVVVDGDGAVVAEFDAAAWEVAHAWVHMRVAEPLTRRPVCIEDHRHRQTWQVDVDSCTHTVWMPGERTGGQRPCPLLMPAQRAAGSAGAIPLVSAQP